MPPVVKTRKQNHKPVKHRSKWDNAWYIVMLEIPETNRKIRDLFWSDLIRMRFGLLYNSVYISPWDYTQEVSELATNYRIHENIALIKGSFLANSVTPQKAQKIWQLATKPVNIRCFTFNMTVVPCTLK